MSAMIFHMAIANGYYFHCRVHFDTWIGMPNDLKSEMVICAVVLSYRNNQLHTTF